MLKMACSSNNAFYDAIMLMLKELKKQFNIGNKITILWYPENFYGD
jgi:hypothetical protein